MKAAYQTDTTACHIMRSIIPIPITDDNYQLDSSGIPTLARCRFGDLVLTRSSKPACASCFRSSRQLRSHRLTALRTSYPCYSRTLIRLVGMSITKRSRNERAA